MLSLEMVRPLAVKLFVQAPPSMLRLPAAVSTNT